MILKPFALAILLAIFVEYLLFLVATYMNIIHLNNADFKKIHQDYSFNAFRKACLYTKSRSKYELIATVLCIVAFMLFWMYYGFTALDALVTDISGSSILRGIVFWTLIVVICGIVKTIFNAYVVFVIEEKFGFNTRTWGRFLKDNVIETMSALCLLIPAVALFTAIYSLYGDNSWWICLIVFGTIIFIFETKLPKYLIKEFYKAAPIPEGNLKNRINIYCKQIHLPVENIFIVDTSKRTRRMNATFYGLGKSRIIMLSDNLIKNCTNEEILCVIGHEAGHSRLHHVLKTSLLNLILFGVFMYFFDYFTENISLYQAFFVYSRAYYSGLCFYSLLCIIPAVIIMPFYRTYYRKLQQDADLFALHTVKDKDSLISVMKKLSKTNLVNPLPHPFYITLFYSQFPIEHRIKVIEDVVV